MKLRHITLSAEADTKYPNCFEIEGWTIRNASYDRDTQEYHILLEQ